MKITYYNGRRYETFRSVTGRTVTVPFFTDHDGSGDWQ